MIQGAIFDLDGTILDSTEIWTHAAEWYLKDLGVIPREDLSEQLFTMSMIEGAEYIIKEYKVSKTPEEIAAGVNHLVLEKYTYEIPVKPGVVDVLKAFQERQIPMVLATATDRELFVPALKRCGLEDYLLKIFTCTEVGAGKESPAIFNQAAKEICDSQTMSEKDTAWKEGEYRKHIWVFEDGLYAMKTAKKAGFSVAGIYDIISDADQEEIREIADVYGKNWAQLGEMILQKISEVKG